MTVNGNDLASAAAVLRAAGFSVAVPQSSTRMLSIDDAAARLRMGRTYVKARLGEFPGARRLPGGDIRIPEADLERWIASHPHPDAIRKQEVAA
jgi:predicted DNA-binding transcriptional regulator AlpA